MMLGTPADMETGRHTAQIKNECVKGVVYKRKRLPECHAKKNDKSTNQSVIHPLLGEIKSLRDDEKRCLLCGKWIS
jgi:hypothetical protein